MIEQSGGMDSITALIAASFVGLPAHPPISLRGGNALDDYETPPAFDLVIDKVTPEYLEKYGWGIAHLDSESWRFYLPHYLAYAIQHVTDASSTAMDAFLASLRPPDRDPPRFGTLSEAEEKAIVAVLDRLAFSEDSAWQREAMLVLEEYWAPGAIYR